MQIVKNKPPASKGISFFNDDFFFFLEKEAVFYNHYILIHICSPSHISLSPNNIKLDIKSNEKTVGFSAVSSLLSELSGC